MSARNKGLCLYAMAGTSVDEISRTTTPFVVTRTGLPFVTVIVDTAASLTCGSKLAALTYNLRLRSVPHGFHEQPHTWTTEYRN